MIVRIDKMAYLTKEENGYEIMAKKSTKLKENFIKLLLKKCYYKKKLTH